MQKIKYVIQNYNTPIYPIILIIEMIINDFPKTFRRYWVKRCIAKWVGDFNEIYTFDDLENKNSAYFQRRIVNSDLLKQTRHNIFKQGDSLIKFTEKFPRLNLKSISDKQLVDLYLEFNNKYKQLCLWGWVPNAVDGRKNLFSNKLEKKLKNILIKRRNEQKIGEYYTILTSKSKISLREEVKIELLRICLKIKNNCSIKELFTENSVKDIIKILPKYLKFQNLIKRYAQKYGWLTFNYNGPIYSYKNCVSEIKLFLKEKQDIKLELINLQKKAITTSRQKENITKELNLPINLKREFNALSELFYLKNFRKNILYQAHYHVQFLLKEMARRLNYPLNLMYYLLPCEVTSLFLGQLNKKGFKDSLKDRLNLSVLRISLSGIQLFTGKKANSILKKYNIKRKDIVKKNNKIIQLKGQIASSGFYQGKAKIINSKNDINKFKKGEILVSVKTDPALLPAMQRSGAIITEMGGITSHAAIVSRELQKPCIIGVKSATAILKDGNKILVDANEGKITIL
ncbi:hypothetical protein KKC83_06660 [Patescibacteria group bacterium]|nr:hypothetical protein [Candidatus Falkowbacteria bacterium]MBU3905858.1 hypothetical protein [Patescibacteria group bacterium]MBU4015061.1 hypothetical protein [Patescibacteria group bacterium]MBU4027195.1 hypothetical protein [Patescibacteria group bacterium]MBU4073374.1 hypothetical protein [Patescibacteria group bacterium]